MRTPTRAFGLLLALLFVAACGGNEAQNSESAAAGNAAAQNAGAISGPVLETMDAGGYTYARLEADGKEVWAAGPMTPLEVGTTVTVSTRMPQRGFHSETLERTFETLYFVSDWGSAPKAADPHGGMMGGDMGMAGHGKTPAADVAVGSVTPVEGGHTVAALFTQRAELAGTKTSVRGRVVKFNGGIMGKNWVHVQDGTGDAAAKTHDLLITTDGTCAVGDLITATGTVTVEKDFGAGYSYELLLEDASIEVDRSTTGR